MINILLVDDQALLCEVLKTWLDIEQDLQVVGVAHNGEEAIDQVEKLQPDIVLMDIDMPQMNGLNATKIICQRFPQVKVIFLSGHDDDAYLGKSLRAGAKGYLLKNTTAEELVLKIRSVYNDVNLLDSSGNNKSLGFFQNQLEELIETYQQKFIDRLAEHENVIANSNFSDDLEQKYEQRIREIEDKLYAKQVKKINELEYKNQSSWESVRKELISVNSQFNQANRNLTLQFNQQINLLKQDLDEKLSDALEDWLRQRAALQEWAVQRDEMRPSMEEYESKNRHELMSVVNPIRASFGDVDKQFKKMRTWTIASSIFTLIALVISGYLLFSQVQSGNFPFNSTEDVGN
ncbi:response regulator transcription factor [Waterburya agarophytonicola K14]|uniref:Response regulator transcription factor n=1 Tax=Waterburya agarophytonicola KI4 TaxID=2874699 RepID=A0A964BPU7_9CYAN|nr:response regulator transcription factor [Waterburya agarophytonicola]MCC0176288.1 response regulator transcription factor [Waterburya agarophytonicola KI4]